MYTGAALSFGLIRACRGGLVLYCSVLSDAGGENDGSSAIFERSLLQNNRPARWAGQWRSSQRRTITFETVAKLGVPHVCFVCLYYLFLRILKMHSSFRVTSLAFEQLYYRLSDSKVDLTEKYGWNWPEPKYNKTPQSHDDVIKWKLFSALLALCAGNSLVTGEFPSQRTNNVEFDVSLIWVRPSC